MRLQRRTLLSMAGLAAAALPAFAQANPPLLRARRLQPGDTIALVNPSGALHERAPYEVATETLLSLGFKVREAPHLRARYGHLAGSDRQRADDALHDDVSEKKTGEKRPTE